MDKPPATDTQSPHPEEARKPIPRTNPAWATDDKESYAGRPDQDVKRTVGPGAGGATEWGGGNKNHPSRIKGRPPGR